MCAELSPEVRTYYERLAEAVALSAEQVEALLNNPGPPSSPIPSTYMRFGCKVPKQPSNDPDDDIQDDPVPDSGLFLEEDEEEENEEKPDPRLHPILYEIRSFPASVKFASSENEVQNDPELAEKGYKIVKKSISEFYPLPGLIQLPPFEPSIADQSENLPARTTASEDDGFEPEQDENIVDEAAPLSVRRTEDEIVVAQEEVLLEAPAENLRQLPAESTNFVQFLKENWSNYRASVTELEFSSQLAQRTVLPSAGQQVFVTFALVFSPKEFYFHMDGEMPALETLSTLLAEFYDKATGPQGAVAPVDPDKIEVGHACMVRDAETAKWCRAVVKEKGSEDCHLQLVDWGRNQFTMYPQIFPLISFAAGLPPFAIHAQLHDLETRELMQKAIQRFRQEIQHSHDRAVVEFSAGPAFTDPAEVQLRSLTGLNIGYQYSVAAYREQKMQRACQSAASRTAAKQSRTDGSRSKSKVDDKSGDGKVEGTSLAFSVPAGASRRSTETVRASSSTIPPSAAVVQNFQPKSAGDEEEQLQLALKLSLRDQ